MGRVAAASSAPWGEGRPVLGSDLTYVLVITVAALLVIAGTVWLLA